jgi:hypothetical protein
MKPYVYVYVDPERGVPIYVGKGRGARANKHLRRADNLQLRNRLIALRAMGLEPTISILPMASDAEALAEERRLIAFCGRRDLGTGSLYNRTDGGEGASGMVVSAETRRQISERNRRDNLSPETRRRQRWKRGPDVGAAISAAAKRREASMSAEARAARTTRLAEQAARPETRAKMSAAAKARAPVTCPHCGRVGKAPGIYKHHFARCGKLVAAGA